MVLLHFSNDGTQGLGATESISKTGKAVVGEINKRILKITKATILPSLKSPQTISHDILLQQGIESDGTRGLSTASARREVPAQCLE